MPSLFPEMVLCCLKLGTKEFVFQLHLVTKRKKQQQKGMKEGWRERRTGRDEEGKGSPRARTGQAGREQWEPPHTQKPSHMDSASVGSILVAMEPKHHLMKLMLVDQVLTPSWNTWCIPWSGINNGHISRQHPKKCCWDTQALGGKNSSSWEGAQQFFYEGAQPALHPGSSFLTSPSLKGTMVKNKERKEKQINRSPSCQSDTVLWVTWLQTGLLCLPLHIPEREN